MGFFFEWVIILKPVITINLCMLLCDGWLQPSHLDIDSWTNKHQATVRQTNSCSYDRIVLTGDIIFITCHLLRAI